MAGLSPLILDPSLGPNVALNNTKTQDVEISEPPTGRKALLIGVDLSSNRIRRFALSGQLRTLTTLHLGNNRLVSIPSEICNQGSLKVLSVWGNRLVSLPIEIGKLSKLEKLDAWGNDLLSLPHSIGLLQALRVLHLEANDQLTCLPTTITFLDVQCAVHVTQNCVSPPQTVCCTGMLAMRQWYSTEDRVVSSPRSASAMEEWDRMQASKRFSAAAEVRKKIKGQQHPALLFRSTLRQHDNPTKDTDRGNAASTHRRFMRELF